MSLRINFNAAAANAHRQLQSTDSAVNSSIEKLSSGYRINRAADDPAGLAISENLRAQISGTAQAVKNSSDAVNMIKTAEGALAEVHTLLRGMRDLAVHAASTGNNDATALAADQTQITSSLASLDRIAANTQFGNKNLLNDTTAGGMSLTFQVGSNSGQTMDVSIKGTSSTTLGVNAINVSTGAAAAITAIDAAIASVSTNRASLGASQKTLESTINSLSIAQENLSASESTIRDTDMAQEMVKFTRNQIMAQSGVSMLAQANQAPQMLLKLLG